MFRTTRFIVGSSITGGVVLAGVIAWLTGLFDKLFAAVGGLWDTAMAWISTPVHFGLSLGALAVPVIIIIIILLALTDPQ